MKAQTETWNPDKEMSRLNVIKNNKPKSPRVVLYGGPGVGKTTFAASAEKPIFICTEDGLGKLTVDHFPMITTYDEIIEYIGTLVEEEHDYKTLVIDSLDWMESIIWQKVAADHGKNSIEDIGFAKGYIFALNYWREILTGVDYLKNNKGMMPILLAHSQIKPFQSPTTETYDRYCMKLHSKANAVVSEWADALLYAGYKVATKEDKKDHVRGIGRGERILYTEERPGFEAKNRYSLPTEMPFTYASFMSAMKD